MEKNQLIQIKYCFQIATQKNRANNRNAKTGTRQRTIQICRCSHITKQMARNMQCYYRIQTMNVAVSNMLYFKEIQSNFKASGRYEKKV